MSAAQDLVTDLADSKRISRLEADVLRKALSVGEDGSPRDFSPEGMRAWVLGICEQMDIAPTRLAALAGMAASTFNRWLSCGRGDNAGLNSSTINALIGVLRGDRVAG